MTADFCHSATSVKDDCWWVPVFMGNAVLSGGRLLVELHVTRNKGWGSGLVSSSSVQTKFFNLMYNQDIIEASVKKK